MTWCALLTGVGRAAIAVIELGGPRASECLLQLFHPASQHAWTISQVRYGRWGGQPGPVEESETSPVEMPIQNADATESVIVVPTGHQRYEIHCHGGKAAIERLLDDLGNIGVVRIAAQEIPGGSFPSATGNERLREEAVAVLSRCMTTRTAAIALDQVRGALQQWRDRSIRDLANNHSIAPRIANQASQIASAAPLGLRLTRAADVVLAGPPNVGKSSLINALVGYDRSIIMNIPGTTRDVLDAETVIEGWPVRLRDTAGLHPTDHAIERQGIERALKAIETADLVILVTQPPVAGEPPVAGDPEHVERLIGQLDQPVAILRVVNKYDLADPADARFQAATRSAIATVATTGQGISELLRAIADALQSDTPQPGAPVPINQRQLDWVTRIASLGDNPDEMRDCLNRG